MIGKGSAHTYLDKAAVLAIVAEAIEAMPIRDKRVLILIPDGTRTAPIPQMFRLFQELLRPRVKALDYLVALGTHPPMNDAQLSKIRRRYPGHHADPLVEIDKPYRVRCIAELPGRSAVDDRECIQRARTRQVPPLELATPARAAHGLGVMLEAIAALAVLRHQPALLEGLPETARDLGRIGCWFRYRLGLCLRHDGLDPRMAVA